MDSGDRNNPVKLIILVLLLFLLMRLRSSVVRSVSHAPTTRLVIDSGRPGGKALEQMFECDPSIELFSPISS